MNYKKQLNDILRLRIFFQTEREMSQYIGYQLKGNHFNKFKDFQTEAYWSMFDRMCRKYSGDIYDLDNLMVNYEATSNFWYRYISGKKIIADDCDLKDFVNASLLGQYANNIKPKVKALADVFSKQETIDMALLLLLTWGVIPRFTQKSQQDIADIKGDFDKVYERLRTFNLMTCKEGNPKFDDVACLQELHYMVDKNCIIDPPPCRMTLIALTNKILVQIMTLKNRNFLVDSLREKHLEMLDIDGFWIADDTAQNETWVIMRVENTGFYMFYHCTIDFKQKEIHYKRWQLCFVKTNTANSYQTSIADRKFDYYNLIGSEMPTRYLHNDYTSITFYPHEKCAEQMRFHFNSPLGNKPLTLNRPTENLQDYYCKLFDSYEQIDDEEEYDVQLTQIHTAISLDAIYMRVGGCTYKLEKFRDDKETIEGICKLSSTNDNFFMATLKVDGTVRQYILIDTINFSMTKDDFLKLCTISSF